MKKITLAIPIVLALFAFGLTQSAWAQNDDGVYYDLPDQGENDLLSAEELDKLLGPIALYPDPLIAQMLPAATFVDQIAEAAQYLRANGTRAGIDDQPWDVSVKAVAHYPDVLYMMDENYDWTVSLGQAYVDQPQDVMESVQRLRAEARAQGNLYSTKQQQVVVEQDVIRVVPASPEYVYVPVYDPDVIYYERYSPAFPFITFTTGFVIGAWLNRDCDWHRHRVYYHGWRGGGWVGRARPHIHDRRGVYINRRAANININRNVMLHDARPFRQELRGETIRRRQGPMLRPGHQTPGRMERRRERQGPAGTPPARGERAVPGRPAPATSAPATPVPGTVERRGQGRIERRGPAGSEGEVPAGERRMRGREMGGAATGGAVSPAVRPAPVRQVPAAQPPAVRRRPSSTGQRPAPPIRSRSITGPSTSGQSTGGDVSVQPTPVQSTPAVRQPATTRGVPRSPRGSSTGREGTIYRQRGESGREGIRQPVRPTQGPRSVSPSGPTTPAVRSVPQSRPAPRIERPVVVPPSPRSSVPSVPRVTAPAAPGSPAPVVPRSSVPAPPRSAAPSVPRSVTVPITPRASTPVIPRSSAPAVPRSVTPAIPRSSVPASIPRSAPPASPSAVSPATPGAAPATHGGPIVPTGR